MRFQSVRLIAHSTFQPPTSWEVSSQRFERIARGGFKLDAGDVDWTMKLLVSSGIGERSAFPPGISDDPPHTDVRSARAEAEVVIIPSVQRALAAANMSADDVDILIVNCSLFVPTPSLAALIINQLAFRRDVDSYNLGGMGCGAGLVAIHLASSLLQSRPLARCLIVSTENITGNIYCGREKAMLISNALFRVGGAAMIMTNRWSDRFCGATARSYRLQWTYRTHCGADDGAYQCVYADIDDNGFSGVRLDRQLVTIAAKAIRTHITDIAVYLLTTQEIIRVAVGRLFGATKSSEAPSFSGCGLYCVHAGGKSVLDGVQRSLSLSDDEMSASRYVLHRYGNVSSASVWYALAHLEEEQRVHRGERVWMLSFGSGFKVASAVWIAE